MQDRSSNIFGNPISKPVVKKAQRQKKNFLKKFGDDSAKEYHFTLEDNAVLNEFIGLQNLVLSEESQTIELKKPMIIGNIRMGYGHYRISFAIASCARAMGYTPLWLDLNAYPETTASKIIRHLNGLYSLGSRLSQKYSLFNKWYWEPLNSEGFRKLSFNAKDQKMTELMAGLHKNIPKNIPYAATHVWPAQAAVHAGFEKVINVIPDNWQMGLHLAEGAIHTTQSFSSYLGYKTLRGMDGKKVLNPIPSEQIKQVGHYIDHELVVNLEGDTRQRIERVETGKPLRILFTVGGAGAQQELIYTMLQFLKPYLEQKKVCVLLNVGDHKNFRTYLNTRMPELESTSELYINDWKKTKNFAERALREDLYGIHFFHNEDIFEAVYSSNLLMRASDVLITKPSELAFYPLPKLLVKRVGGHEAWGAIRSAELGDGTMEADHTPYALQLLQLMIEDPEILKLMNNNILQNHKIGLYNGAYEVIKLAEEK